MNKQTPLQGYRLFEDLLQKAPTPEWVRKMVEHYRRTGTYRAEDLRRLLGDPTKGVEIGPNSSLTSDLAARAKRSNKLRELPEG